MNNTFDRFLWVLCLLALGLIGSPLAAQQASPPATGAANAQLVGHTTSVPYSADRVSVTTQTLADGTKITHKNFSKVYRDSQGRIRDENFATKAETGERDDAPRSISIYDPVAGVTYYLNPGEHTAQRNEFRKVTRSTTQRTSGASTNPAPPALPRPAREELGTQVIEGLEAKGLRITRIVPEGAEGNDRPLQSTDERWVAEKEHIVLLTISNDPRRGETEMRLSNVVLDEPPAELFQVPADYTIKELQTVAKPEPASD